MQFCYGTSRTLVVNIQRQKPDFRLGHQLEPEILQGHAVKRESRSSCGLGICFEPLLDRSEPSPVAFRIHAAHRMVEARDLIGERNAAHGHSEHGSIGANTLPAHPIGRSKGKAGRMILTKPAQPPPIREAIRPNSSRCEVGPCPNLLVERIRRLPERPVERQAVGLRPAGHWQMLEDPSNYSISSQSSVLRPLRPFGRRFALAASMSLLWCRTARDVSRPA